MQDLTVEQYHMVYPEWYRSVLNWLSFMPSSRGKNEPHLKYAYHHSCLVSDYTINLNAEDPEPTDIDNESTHGLDATVALGGPETEVHPNDPIYSNQDKMTALTREINDSHHWVEAGEGHPAESLDSIEHKIQNLSIALHPPLPPTPTEPFREVMCQYTSTLCTTQKQTNLAYSLLQDIAVFNEYDYKIGRMANRHRDSSRSNKWKSSKACQSKIKGINTYIGHWSHQLWQVLGGNKGFTMAQPLQC